MYVYVCVCVCECVCVYVNVICTCVCVYVAGTYSSYLCIYVYVCVCMCMCIYYTLFVSFLLTLENVFNVCTQLHTFLLFTGMDSTLCCFLQWSLECCSSIVKKKSKSMKQIMKLSDVVLFMFLVL